MMTLTGERVRLCAVEADAMAESFVRWSRDSEFRRLQDSDPAHPLSLVEAREMFGDDMSSDSAFSFAIHTREPDRLIGFVGLYLRWPHADAWVGIGLGERDCWGQGYGTEAMRIALRYAFTELNLHRVSLTVLGANPRAQRAYEKAGFVFEGRARAQSQYDGQRVDEVYMGILREEWERR
ncbi:MAG: GNAT family N-acetyltransferase [Anaerolineales bacterium]